MKFPNKRLNKTIVKADACNYIDGRSVEITHQRINYIDLEQAYLLMLSRFTKHHVANS